jgi:murein L,D-transpeptidase YafK
VTPGIRAKLRPVPLHQTVVQVFRRLAFFLAAFGLFSATAFANTTPVADRIVVVKSERLLAIYNGSTLVKSFRIALGKNPDGPKRKQGDSRTPEGRYTIDYRNAKSAFYRALHISYPNKDDVQLAQALGVSPGGSIMIHGLPNGIAAVGENEDWTEGCIAVSNDAMDELWTLVADGTPITIVP